MAYYKVRIEVWCDWNPAESDLDDIVQSMGVGEAICTMREVVAVVDRPQDIEDEDALAFFGGEEGMRNRTAADTAKCSRRTGEKAAARPNRTPPTREITMIHSST
jgi:hypothetical protein